MEGEIIKPNKKKKIEKEKKENNNILTPIIYLIVGIILAFKSNEAVKLVIYIIGILVIVYGIKSLVTYLRSKDEIEYGNISLGVSIVSIVIGILIMALSGVLEASIRYVIGFFLLFMGISRLMMSFSFGTLKSINTVGNVLLIVLGLYSIFFSNVVLVIIGWFLIVYAAILLYEYIVKK